MRMVSLIGLGLLLVGCGPPPASDSGETSTSEDGATTEETDTGEPCPEPITIDGDVFIEDASEIPDYECVAEITGNLEFESVEMLVLDGFPRLERVGGSLFIAWTGSMSSITGFPELREVGSLIIYEHASLESISGFAELEHVVEDLRIEDMPALVDIAGLAAVTTVGHWLFVRNAPMLESLSALGVASVGAQLEISDCDGLVDLAGFEQLTTLPTTYIFENDELLSLAGFEQVTHMVAFELVNNAALADLDALANLATVDDNLRIVGNASLDSIDGLAGLIEVSGNFEIIDNDALLDPEIPMTVGGHVQICENASLIELPDTMPTAIGASVIRNASLPNASALAFVIALGHPDGKVAANEDLADYPIDPCAFIGDGVCDETEKAQGDVVTICDPQTGEGCCEFGGPTGLCLFESEGWAECPGPVGPP